MRVMTGRPRIYLAGPGVFRMDAEAYGATLKVMCASCGLEGVYPLDEEPSHSGPSPREQAQGISDVCLRLLLGCDAVMADMTPFRGVSMDGGTIFEMGFAAARGMPIAGWTRCLRPYRERVADAHVADGRLCDPRGMLVEDFGLSDNLMMACALHGDANPYTTPEEALDALARMLLR